MSESTEMLELLRQINGKVDRLSEDILHLRTVEDSHTHLLNRHTELLDVHTATLNILLQDVRLLRGAVIDVAKREVLTPGQLMVLHEDMNRLHFQVSEVAVRIETIEARLPH